MEGEATDRRDRWLAKMLASSVALAAAMVLLAWAAPGLRLGYYGLRYRLDWGRDEALDVLAEEALQRRLSPVGVRLLLGEPRFWGRTVEGRERLLYTGDGANSWLQGVLPCRDFEFDDGALTNVSLWGEFWENGLDDDLDDPGNGAAPQPIYYDDRGVLMFRRRFDAAYLGHEWGGGTPPPSRLQRVLNRFRWRE